jgi:hypothetical protein
MGDRPEYLLRLRAAPGDVPPGRRLARLLKALLRSYGMKCLDVREIGPTQGLKQSIETDVSNICLNDEWA